MKNLVVIFLVASTLYSNAACTINCNVRYRYTQPIEQGNYSGSIIGSTTQYAPNGGNNYVWSQWYNVNVTFYSGYELNEKLGGNYFNTFNIIAYVPFSNGSYSLITINNWYTEMKYITRDEVLYSSTGYRIQSVNGYDKDNTYWEMTF